MVFMYGYHSILVFARKAMQKAQRVLPAPWKGVGKGCLMWFAFALLSALFQVLRNMAMKQLGHALDETINVWGRFTFLLPFAAIGVLYNGTPTVEEGFFRVSLLFGISQVLATLSLSRALKQSDISLVTSLWKLSLVVLVVWGYATLGEVPSSLGLAGVMVSMTGVYLLNVNRARISFWAPIVALFKEPGQRWTLLAAMGYATSVILIKKMALLSDPMFAVLAGYIFCVIIITPYTLYRSRRHFPQIGRYWKTFSCLGLFAALATWFGTTAYTLTLSSYVEAVKQIEILLALVIGYLFFNEGATIRRIWLGTGVMSVGLIMIKLGT